MIRLIRKLVFKIFKPTFSDVVLNTNEKNLVTYFPLEEPGQNGPWNQFIYNGADMAFHVFANREGGLANVATWKTGLSNKEMEALKSPFKGEK